jgi:hypothetical protein
MSGVVGSKRSVVANLLPVPHPLRQCVLGFQYVELYNDSFDFKPTTMPGWTRLEIDDHSPQEDSP